MTNNLEDIVVEGEEKELLLEGEREEENGDIETSSYIVSRLLGDPSRYCLYLYLSESIGCMRCLCSHPPVTITTRVLNLLLTPSDVHVCMVVHQFPCIGMFWLNLRLNWKALPKRYGRHQILKLKLCCMHWFANYQLKLALLSSLRVYSSTKVEKEIEEEGEEEECLVQVKAQADDSETEYPLRKKNEDIYDPLSEVDAMTKLQSPIFKVCVWLSFNWSLTHNTTLL